MTNERKCRYCGGDLPAPHIGRGKQKQFCNDVCRVMKGYRNRNGVTTNRQRLERHLGHAYRRPELSEPEKAWLAAMLDGEGCVTLIRNQRTTGTKRWYIAPSVSVCNTNRKIIDRVVEIVGAANSRVQHKDRSKERSKDLMAVFVNRIAIADVLDSVKPYLVAKNRQAEIVTDFCRTHDGMPCKTAPLERFEEMQKETATLNKRGIN